MGSVIIVVAVAAGIGVGLVVYGTLRSQQPAGPEEQVRVSYRTLADVREQLRRRFESTGTPNWIAAEQQTSKLQRDLVSADFELRPYEFRIIQAGAALLLAVLGVPPFGVRAGGFLPGAPRYLLPSLYLCNRTRHRAPPC